VENLIKMKKLTAWYEVYGKDQLITLEGDIGLELTYKHFFKPAPFFFTARDSDSLHTCKRPYVSHLVSSRSEFLDLFEKLREKGRESGDFELSLPPIPYCGVFPNRE